MNPAIERAARQFSKELQSFQANGPEIAQAIRVTIELLRGRVGGEADGFQVETYSWRIISVAEDFQDETTHEALQATSWSFMNKESGQLDRTRPSWKHGVTIDPENPNGAWAVFEQEMHLLQQALRPKTSTDPEQFVRDLQSFCPDRSEIKQAIEATMDLLRGQTIGADGIYLAKYSWRVKEAISDSDSDATSHEVLQATEWFKFAEKNNQIDYNRPDWKHAITIDPQNPNGAWSVFAAKMKQLRSALEPVVEAEPSEQPVKPQQRRWRRSRAIVITYRRLSR